MSDARFDEIEAEIAGELARLAGAPLARIGRGTRVYQDLGLAGDDFDDMITWMVRRFSLDLTGLDGRAFAPGEAAGWWAFMAWPFRLRRRTFREMTVGDLADLARAGSWGKSRLGGAAPPTS
jgi:hypothetical protein